MYLNNYFLFEIIYHEKNHYINYTFLILTFKKIINFKVLVVLKYAIT